SSSNPLLLSSLLGRGRLPGNPANTGSEIAWLVKLANPIISFAASSMARKFPNLKLGMILVDGDRRSNAEIERKMRKRRKGKN
ncbi:hypothetical protein LINPERHAP2_LOCUS7616, partial [Linum perenne]